MKKALLSLTAALLACFLLCSCAVGTDVDAIDVNPDERVLQEARQLYHSAALVARGSCLFSHIDSEGRECFDMELNGIIAGDAEPGDVLHCTGVPFEPGEEYLLYLGAGGDVFHTEDTAGYTLLYGEPLRIVDNEVLWNNSVRISIETLKRDAVQQNFIVNIPANFYYYRTLSGLVSAADELFIGRIRNISQWSPMTMRSVADGATVEKSVISSLVTIEALGSIKGKFKYSDTVVMVNTSEKIVDLMDSETLRSKDYAPYETLALKEGGIYLFFLKKGPDAKQTYYFPVNQIQGYVEINGEALSASLSNETFSGERALTPMVQRIQTAIAAELQESSPELKVY